MTRDTTKARHPQAKEADTHWLVEVEKSVV